MAESRGIKYCLDWLQHGYWIGNALLSLGLGRGFMTWLARHVSIAPDWRGVVWLVFSGFIFWTFAFVGIFLRQWKREPAQRQATQGAVTQAVAATPQPLAIITQFYNRLDHRYTAEVETSIRNTVAQMNPADRETYYPRALTVVFIYAQFETLWWIVYASQIKALQQLNNGQLKREGIFPFYTEAAKSFPKLYANYSFDQWLGFMRSQVLIREDGDLIGITIKGKDFLRYLIDDSKPINLKSF